MITKLKNNLLATFLLLIGLHMLYLNIQLFSSANATYFSIREAISGIHTMLILLFMGTYQLCDKNKATKDTFGIVVSLFAIISGAFFVFIFKDLLLTDVLFHLTIWLLIGICSFWRFRKIIYVKGEFHHD